MKERHRPIEYGMISAGLLAIILALGSCEGEKQPPVWTSTPTATPDFTKESTTTPTAELATNTAIQLFGATEEDTWTPEYRGQTKTPRRTPIPVRTRKK